MRRAGSPVPGRRPRVVHLTTVDMSLALLLLSQLTAFHDAGYEVIGMSAPGPFVPELEAAGFRHVPLASSTRSMDLRRDVQALREVIGLFRELEPDIVHTHNPKPGVYGRIGARLARVPAVVNTVHGLYAQPTDSWRRRWPVYGLERLAATFSDAELVQNPEDLPTLRRLGVPEERLHLLGNGVDLSRFDPARFSAGHRAATRRALGIAPDEVVVGLVGRLVVEKGYREVFAAAAAVRRDHPRTRFVVVGPHEPDKADAIGADEVAAAEADGVTFLGMRDDVEALYPAMDLYLLASHREGFPRSAMEAAAMGLPVVATDIRGCRQVVDHARTGLLVPVRDPHALAEAVTSLVADDDRRIAHGRAARRKAAAEFDDRRQVERTLAVYERLLGARARRDDERSEPNGGTH